MEDDLKNYLHKRDKIYDSKALSGYIKTLFSPDVESNVEKTKIFQPQSSPSTPAPAPVPIASLAHGSGEQNRLKGVSRKVKFAAVVLLLIIFICSLVLVKRYYSRQAPAPLAANSELQNRRSSKQESLANTTPDTAIAPLPAKGKPDLPAAENNRASGGLSPTRNSDIVKRTAVADSNVKSRDRSRVNLGVSQNIKKIKQRTRKSPAKSYGFVTIQTDPWTIIFINGKRRGITPIMELKLPIGRYTLVLENREKKIRKTKKITIVKGKTVIINENYLQQE